MTAFMGIVEVAPRIQCTLVGLLNASEKCKFKRFTEAALSRAIGTQDKNSSMIKLKNLLATETPKRPKLKPGQACPSQL
ncbi:hypothetical protein MOU_20188 [Xanthomonas citri pv. malvacearum str. GSPB1386]|nr:hypothetical protein BGK55_12210 [Xanthomonas citri pv. malvacearum]EKQ59445.1 hypothetical protein MOU_20188 [Xanthomonas citri pv. malvacearum str. GSPB1386]